MNENPAGRTHNCGELRAKDSGSKALLFGWVHGIRDHGGVIFIDLRDRYGLTQVVVHPENVSKETLELSRSFKSEFVVRVGGIVKTRPAQMINPELPTGEIEVVADEVELLNQSKTPPFQVEDQVDVGEELRLKFRYLDLRKPSIKDVIVFRHKVAFLVRKFLDGKKFLEIETPILVRPTPEGARDYLVPSRVSPGKFYALPQSPQLYKQLLMVSGFDRYFQIARCLRDEDLRADRQPEHTQIDIEMSFVTVDDVFSLVEEMFKTIFGELFGIDLKTPFLRLSYADSLARFGTDKPDIRFGYEISDVTDEMKRSSFEAFKKVIEAGGEAKALVCKGVGSLSRRELDELTELVKASGGKGLASARVSGGSLEGGMKKFVTPDLEQALVARFALGDGDVVLFTADKREAALKSLGTVRSALGKRALKEREKFSFVWIKDFPIFQWNEDRKAWEPEHHLFCMPDDDSIDRIEKDPGSATGKIYDLVLNGVELGSGSIRVHNRKLQERIMAVAGISRDEAEKRFGFLLEALDYGAPPHGGIALGLDRIVMIMTGRETIRDTIAFPKTQKASSLVDGSPAEVDEKELNELHIRIVE
ncbi:MAG: aspartate--tRNA ligase [Candidatus Eisenbacteria bacterium]|nr:aspartate--tRNA ligase [Candidatus Eisenbacteria bacterium]